MSPENSKPEWFQMADADATPPQPKGKKGLKVLALATPLLLLGAGLVFAQTQDSPTAVASAVSGTATSTADPISNSTPVIAAATSTPATPMAASTPVTNSVQATPATQNVSLTITKPAIATLPTGGREDDGLRTSDDD